MDFGQNLQQLRKEKGLSQEKLADILEVSRQAISKWELNAAYPETEKLIALSNLFNVSMDYLIKGDESKKVPYRKNCQDSSEINAKVHGPNLTGHIFSVRSYSFLRTAFAVILYAISPFWFYFFGELPGGSGKGVFFMFLSIAAATALLVYNHCTKSEKRDKEQYGKKSK